MNKNPKYLKPLDGLTATQRKSLGLEKAPPRVRAAGEATSIVICAASTREPYRTGQGDIEQPVRAGAERAYAIDSLGFRT